MKPGIIYGNALTCIAGFFLASQGSINILLLLFTVVGLSCIIASACVSNNYIDRNIDALMERTKDRALAAGHIAPTRALLFAGIVGILGVSVLYFFTNLLALCIALLGFIVYVFFYSPLKHRTGYALFVGAVAGATPVLVGYTAVLGVLDRTALWLFLFLFVWQVPHFLAIAVYRYDEYAAARVPLLMRGPFTARQRSLARAIFFLSLVVLLVWSVAVILLRLFYW